LMAEVPRSMPNNNITTNILQSGKVRWLSEINADKTQKRTAACTTVKKYPEYKMRIQKMNLHCV